MSRRDFCTLLRERITFIYAEQALQTAIEMEPKAHPRIIDRLIRRAAIYEAMAHWSYKARNSGIPDETVPNT